LRIGIIIRVLPFDCPVVMLLMNVPLRRIMHWNHFIIVKHVVLRHTRHKTLMHTIFPFKLIVGVFYIFFIEVVLDVFNLPVPLSLRARISVIVLVKY
jgi:hypothetical protein